MSRGDTTSEAIYLTCSIVALISKPSVPLVEIGGVRLQRQEQSPHSSLSAANELR